MCYTLWFIKSRTYVIYEWSLRQQEIITNDNLKSLDLDIEGTRNDLEELKKLKEMKPASVTEKNKVRDLFLNFQIT